ncbi:MAG: hypothetical protein M1827_005165 [Pycnora praestabilis]|nr:MAG: hypothetical protein M1827_005165 [Pycnora praestabilis]
MPWQPLPRIAFAIAMYPFQPSSPADLPLELGDELYIIEQGGRDGSWYRGYLVAPPSLLAGLTSVKGQALEARVFSGIFPRSCVEVRELLGEAGQNEENEDGRDGSEELQAWQLANGVLNGGNPSNGPNGIHINGEDGRPRPNGVEEESVKPKRPQKKKRTSTPEAAITRSFSRKTSEQEKRKVHEGRSHQSEHVPDLPKPPRDPNTPKPPAPVPMLKIGDETPTSALEPLVDEISSCLREWHSTKLHDLLLVRNYSLVEKMSKLVKQLDMARRQLLHNVLTTHELKALREKTVWNLVRGNKILSDEIIVRDPQQQGRILTGEDSAVEITVLQSMMSHLETPPVQITEGLTLHHLLVDVRGFAGAFPEPTSLVFYLCSKTQGQFPKPLSESFAIEVPLRGSLTSLAETNKMRTLFTGLSSMDIGDGAAIDSELYLVIKVQTTRKPVSAPFAPAQPLTSRDGNLGTKASPGGKSPSTGSLKGGRRSLMWGQKMNGGSFRNRGNNASKLERPPGSSDSSWSMYPDNHPRAPSASPAIVQTPVKRTTGVGILYLGTVLKQEEDTEHDIDIWTAAEINPARQEQGEKCDEIIQELVRSRSGKHSKSPTAEKVNVYVKPFSSPDTEALIKTTPTLLHDITTTNKIGFSGAPTKPRSDIYLTLLEAFLPLQALLSHPRAGSMPLPQGSGFANLQLTIEVHRASGVRIDDCIFPSSNSAGYTAWRTTVAEKGDAWNQTIRLGIPLEDVPGCHIVMSLADAPDFPFALCWMPLWDQQAFVRDGFYSLLLYKYDETTSDSTSGKGAYLSLPWNSRGKDDVSQDEAVTGPLATLRLQTYLCSTRFSQDKVLLNLLKWRERSVGDVRELLKRVIFVPEIEIVKMLADVFDSLFGVLVEHAGNDELEDLVFNALVTVLGIVHDRRFNLGPLVDEYAHNRFNYPFATPCLLRSFTRLLSNPADAEKSRKLRATFKVAQHIFKFTVNAREQQKVKEAGIGITSTQPTFTRDLHVIFKALEALMKNPAPILVGSKTLVAQHFHTWLPELSGFLSSEEILHIAIDFMDSCATVHGKLILYKLVLIINYSRLDLFSNRDTRKALILNTARWLEPYWGTTESVTEQWRDQVRLCCSVLSTQVNEIGEEASEYVLKIIESYRLMQANPPQEKGTLSLLFPTTYPFPTKPTAGKISVDEALAELSAVLAAIANVQREVHVDLKDFGLANFVSDALQVHTSILACEAFPRSWLSVFIYHHRSTMKSLQLLSGVLIDLCLPDPDEADSFNTELWRYFFTTLLKLVGSDALALETFPEQKRRAVWKIAGDVREHGAELLRQTWEAIGWETSAEDKGLYGLVRMGGYQVQYVPVLVAPVVELCLSVHEGLRGVAVEVLQSMIVSEWTLNEDLAVIQAEMIDCLDRLFKSKHLTESILQKLFVTELLALFEPLSAITENPLYLALKQLVGTIDEFLDLLVAVHGTEMTGEAFYIMHTLRLMKFLKDMQKEDIFVRYVHQLARIQVEGRNPTEAGLALRLHSDLYSWDSFSTVGPLIEPDFPEQTAFDRKEQLYFEMIKYYEDGKSWDNALATYKELLDQYENYVFDFAKLARTQRAMAKIHDTIARGEWQASRYYRVLYRGLGFPVYLRDKHFIFEASPTERLAAFKDRMQQQHPSAQIVPPGQIEDVEGQFLQISAASPHRDLYHPVYQRLKISQTTREYHLSAHPIHFAITTRRQISGDVKEHWVEKTLYTTAETFPTILRRSEIIAVDELRLSPIQAAIERTVRKTQELGILEKRVMDGEDSTLISLTEALSSSVDPTSEVSVALYRALVSDKDPPQGVESIVKHSGSDEEVDPLNSALIYALKVALMDHAFALKRCLSLYTRPAHQATEAELSQYLENTFAPELGVQPRRQSLVGTPLSRALIEAPALCVEPPAEPVIDSTPRDHETHPVEIPETQPEQNLKPARREKNRLSLNFIKRATTDDIQTSPNGIDDIGVAKPENPDVLSLRATSSHRGSFLGDRDYQDDFDLVGNRHDQNGSRQDLDGSRHDLNGSHPNNFSGFNMSGPLHQVNTHESETRASESPTVSDRVDNVKKRLSLLKIGRKNIKASVNVGTSREK